MVELRIGKYGGEDYGSSFEESEPLTSEQMHLNAVYIYQVFKYIYGWSDYAIAGMLGNMQEESSLNPARWQSEDVGNLESGYGLVQWTPATKYLDWCEAEDRKDPSEMDNNIERIVYEYENNLEYYPTPKYKESFEKFICSKQSPYYLACAFAWNYERPYVVLYGSAKEQEQLRQKRGKNAEYWFTYLTGKKPPLYKKKMPVWMMCKQ